VPTTVVIVIVRKNIISHELPVNIGTMVATETTEFFLRSFKERTLFLVVHVIPSIPQTHTVVNDRTATKRRVLVEIVMDALN
jgi:hypothetical protein